MVIDLGKGGSGSWSAKACCHATHTFSLGSQYSGGKGSGCEFEASKGCMVRPCVGSDFGSRRWRALIRVSRTLMVGKDLNQWRGEHS